MSSYATAQSLINGAALILAPVAADNEAERLTRKERELLSLLMQNPGRCISRETLLKTIWKYSDGARTRTVDVHVQRLRRKLGTNASAIKTIVRLGYCWFPDPDSIGEPTPAC